jgi:hypothetical protein
MSTKLNTNHYPILLLFVLSLALSSCDNPSHKPSVGDIYLVQSDNDSYTTWKITKIKSREIWYVPNDYHVSDTIYIDSINIPNHYTDNSRSLKIKEFKHTTTKYIHPKNPIK